MDKNQPEGCPSWIRLPNKPKKKLYETCASGKLSDKHFESLL